MQQTHISIKYIIRYLCRCRYLYSVYYAIYETRLLTFTLLRIQNMYGSGVIMYYIIYMYTLYIHAFIVPTWTVGYKVLGLGFNGHQHWNIHPMVVLSTKADLPEQCYPLQLTRNATFGINSCKNTTWKFKLSACKKNRVDLSKYLWEESYQRVPHEINRTKNNVLDV